MYITIYWLTVERPLELYPLPWIQPSEREPVHDDRARTCAHDRVWCMCYMLHAHLCYIYAML